MRMLLKEWKGEFARIGQGIHEMNIDPTIPFPWWSFDNTKASLVYC